VGVVLKSSGTYALLNFSVVIKLAIHACVCWGGLKVEKRITLVGWHFASDWEHQ